jgi:hypothetical protein
MTLALQKFRSSFGLEIAFITFRTLFPMQAILMGDSIVAAHALQFVMAIWCTFYFMLNVPNNH